MNTNQNVYDYYGHHFFNPWFRKFHKKEGETNDGKNEINNNQNASNTQQENNQMGYNNWQFDPWCLGYGGQGYGWNQEEGGFGYGHNQPQNQTNQPAPPQNQAPQQGENEGGFYDMPYCSLFFEQNKFF